MPARPIKFHKTQQWAEHQARVESHRLRIQAELIEDRQNKELAEKVAESQWLVGPVSSRTLKNLEAA